MIQEALHNPNMPLGAYVKKEMVALLDTTYLF